MFGTKTYELPLSRNYVAHWGMSQAVRELIQNALDSESPFVYSFEGDQEDVMRPWTLKLTSEFSTLPARTLLLGTTSKRDDATAIGSFGEGYKIALLVLTREAYGVEMHNGDLKWRPSFQHSKTFGDEILTIEETRLPDKLNKGLTVFVRGLSNEDRMQIETSCLLMQKLVGEVKHTPFGDILMERPGELYVGNLFICTTKLQRGYNIKPEYMRLERDRQTVSDWDLQATTWQMWLATEDYPAIVKMIVDNVPDVAYARWDTPHLVKEELYRIFREQHPGAIVARDHSEMKELIRQGMTKVVVVHESMHAAITSHPSYEADKPRLGAQQPQQILASWFLNNQEGMSEACQSSFRSNILSKAPYWTLK